ncbi:MAG: hypothetical protein FJX72_18635, partial [Armatimonadetes bacterium]|nr:hypothetical protein [Armatimonadota bacterium]
MSSPEVGKGADPSTRRQPDRPDLRRASHWLCAASGRDPSLVAALNRVYGSGSDVVHARTGRIAAMARTYHARFGDAPVVLARAPGRVNLMGRHIDHQGGHCNMLAIEADLYVMAGLRDDATVRMMDP